jgi:hypothetical protein
MVAQKIAAQQSEISEKPRSVTSKFVRYMAFLRVRATFGEPTPPVAWHGVEPFNEERFKMNASQRVPGAICGQQKTRKAIAIRVSGY